ncbi:MAG TPA: tRNA 2-selenouridine(34) synthase MnmH, partial [Burkholderiales bacterium]|nr:tRNA 2-selenouridine(34) synthase MnmH [Burkholderiales bacterium]
MKAGDFAGFDTLIDARTPGEYAEDHIPGAVSAPVLDDAERAEVGTLYKRVSPFEAKKVGAALVARNVSSHIEKEFAGKPKDWRPLVYCWRGGKRSGAMAHILREVGWDAHTLEGGYKAYRRWVVEQLSVLPEKLSFEVVHGPTGSGKSRFLGALRAAGAQVLDLEALAAHRGSVLGALPGHPQPSQKMFESMLLQAMMAFERKSVVFVEAESKKIGERQVPEALMRRIRA